MIIADTSGLLAFVNRREPAHEAVREAVEAEPEPLVVSPYVVAELGYLVATRLGVDAELSVLDELTAGAYHLATVEAAEVRQATSVIRRYRDLQIGLADASLVVLADRYRTRSVLTLGRRHFTVLRPLTGGRFHLIP